MNSVEAKAIWRGVLRKRTFTAHDIDDVVIILRQLQNEKHTGPITVNMSQGGIREVCAEDRAALPT